MTHTPGFEFVPLAPTGGLLAAIAVVLVVLALALLTLALRPGVLRENRIGILSKTGYGVVTLAGIVFSLFLYYWQLL